jgi:broad specificity phosphatase PhoE
MSSIAVYIFRHGETDWNAQRRFQGHTDIPLNDKGREQAKTLGSILKMLHLEVILSSDLSRALETARLASSGLNIPIEISKNLREAYLGEPEGKLRDEIIQFYGEDSWQKWLSVKPEDMDFAYPKGETKRQQLKRVLDFVLDYFGRHPHLKSVAISTHGGTLRRLLHFCEGAPAESIPIPNCSIYKLEFKPAEQRWIYHHSLALGAKSEKLFT